MLTPEQIEISEWSACWAEMFAQKAAALRGALGDQALRIDHIGSTAVAGLAAKPIIDIQISVADFGQMAHLVQRLTSCGYVHRASNPDLTKRYFRETPGEKRTHVHVRQWGTWYEQWPLLFRDYMRARPDEHAPYVALKRELMDRHGNDREAYADGKMDHLWDIIRRADRWGQQTGWRLAASDA